MSIPNERSASHLCHLQTYVHVACSLVPIDPTKMIHEIVIVDKEKEKRGLSYQPI